MRTFGLIMTGLIIALTIWGCFEPDYKEIFCINPTTGQPLPYIRQEKTNYCLPACLVTGALVWCIRKPGRDLRDKAELWLAWKRVAREIAEGTLGGEFDRAERADIQSKVSGAEEAAMEEVWGCYRFAILADSQDATGLKTIDLGAGHSSSGQTLCGRVIAALKSEALLNESVGVGYLERSWPPALKDSGAWPLASLRQSFLNGSLTRLLDPDLVLKTKVTEFVERGDFGLASGQSAGGVYDRVWFEERISPDEVAFEKDVYLLTKAAAKKLKAIPSKQTEPVTEPTITPSPIPEPIATPSEELKTEEEVRQRTIHVSGKIPPEIWNRLGTKLLPKLRSGADLDVGVSFTVSVSADSAILLISELRQILDDLNLSGSVKIES